jgi:predicted RNase H-like HicB family nuclease
MIQERDLEMELTANIHREDGSYWADVPKLPGCFASGDTLDELFDSLREGVQLYLDEGGSDGDHRKQPLLVRSAVLSDAPAPQKRH